MNMEGHVTRSVGNTEESEMFYFYTPSSQTEDTVSAFYRAEQTSALSRLSTHFCLIHITETCWLIENAWIG